MASGATDVNHKDEFIMKSNSAVIRKNLSSDVVLWDKEEEHACSRCAASVWYMSGLKMVLLQFESNKRSPLRSTDNHVETAIGPHEPPMAASSTSRKVHMAWREEVRRSKKE